MISNQKCTNRFLRGFFGKYILCLLLVGAGDVKSSPLVKHGAPEVTVYDTRCEAMSSPVGVDGAHPFFSWKLASHQRNIMQYAYQVIVAGSVEALEKDSGCWNSGKIITDQNTFIYYKGIPLESATRYFWKVKVWIDGSKRPFSSKTSFFVSGLLRQSDWAPSSWIAFEKLPDSMKVFPGVHGFGNHLGNKAIKRAVIPCFRKNIPINKRVKEAFVFACGLGQSVFFVNGKRIDSSFCGPAWSDYTKRCYYNAYDVTDLLKQGYNAISAIAGTGFLYVNRERYRKFVVAEDYPMIRLQLQVHYEDGSSAVIATDGSWKTRPSAITYSSIYGGEDYDANKEMAGWKKPGFDDTYWKRAIPVEGPGGKLQAQNDYPVNINTVFPVVHIDSTRRDDFIYDFGQNVSGMVRLKVIGKKGYRIRITPAEILNDQMLPDQRASGKPHYWNYIMAGNGTETWQPLFSYYGFRYASVEVFDTGGTRVPVRDGVSALSLYSLHTQNAASQAGDFSCSDSLFNKIFSLIRWGIRNNLSNVSTDCPHREKLGWLEQTYLMGNSIQYNYDILSFYRKITTDMMDAQLPDGLVPDIAPEYVVFKDGFRDSPEWGSASILVPWYMYHWYGDKNILEKSYPMMKKYIGYLRGKSKGYLLDYGLGDWFDLGPGAPGSSQLTPQGLTASAYYFYDMATIGKIATVLQDTTAALTYTRMADSIKVAFNRKFYNEKTRIYGSGSQTSLAIPLYFGLVEEADRQLVLANLVDSIRQNGYRLTAGDIGFRYVLQVLENSGENEVIYHMNHTETRPGYGFQISQGATALTESWQALKDVSNDHMMLGHLMEWFYSGLAGIRQPKDSVGFKNIQIAPQFLPEINRVKCSYRSANGPVKIDWWRDEDKILWLKVEIPPNSQAVVVLPADRISVFSEDKKNVTVPTRPVKGKDAGRQTKAFIGSGVYLFQFSKNQMKS